MDWIENQHKMEVLAQLENKRTERQSALVSALNKQYSSYETIVKMIEEEIADYYEPTVEDTVVEFQEPNEVDFNGLNKFSLWAKRLLGAK